MEASSGSSAGAPMSIDEEIEFLRKAAASIRKIAAVEPHIAPELTRIAQEIDAEAAALVKLRARPGRARMRLMSTARSSGSQRPSRGNPRCRKRVDDCMHSAAYYRKKAERVRQLARQISDSAYDDLMGLAKDFDELVEDLLHGAVEIRHPELAPQRQQRQRGD